MLQERADKTRSCRARICIPGERRGDEQREHERRVREDLTVGECQYIEDAGSNSPP